jgi:hypothetical protein
MGGGAPVNFRPWEGAGKVQLNEAKLVVGSVGSRVDGNDRLGGGGTGQLRRRRRMRRSGGGSGAVEMARARGRPGDAVLRARAACCAQHGS